MAPRTGLGLGRHIHKLLPPCIPIPCPSLVAPTQGSHSWVAAPERYHALVWAVMPPGSAVGPTSGRARSFTWGYDADHTCIIPTITLQEGSWANPDQHSLLKNTTVPSQLGIVRCLLAASPLKVQPSCFMGCSPRDTSPPPPPFLPTSRE